MATKQNCWVCHTLSDKELLGFTPAASASSAPSAARGGTPLVIGR